MKIDTTKIAGYAEMSAEEKLKALEAFEYDDAERVKGLLSKANAEAAEWKRKHHELLSEDEKQKQEREESISAMQKELDELRTAKTVSEFTAKLVSQGYDEALAADTAKAMAAGDSAKVFANQQKFLDAYTQRMKAEILKNTPTPQGGGASGLDYKKKIEEARAAGDVAAEAYYTRLQAQTENH